MIEPLEEELRSTLFARAAAFSPRPPRYSGISTTQNVERTRVRRRTKIVGGGVLVAALAAGAVPAAAATGLAPGIADAFGWTHQTSGALPLIPADDSTGHLVLTEQATPEFAQIQLYAANTVTAGETCVTAVSQLAGQVIRAQGCGGSSVKTLTDGGGGGSATGVLELIEAPGAAYITVGNRPDHVPVAEGVTAIWLGSTEINVPVSVRSYSQTGQQLQSITIDEPVGLPKVNLTGPGPGTGANALHGISTGP